MEPIIRLENIHQVFDDVTVLDDITLDIYPGEIVSIIDHHPTQTKDIK